MATYLRLLLFIRFDCVFKIKCFTTQSGYMHKIILCFASFRFNNSLSCFVFWYFLILMRLNDMYLLLLKQYPEVHMTSYKFFFIPLSIF